MEHTFKGSRNRKLIIRQSLGIVLCFLAGGFLEAGTDSGIEHTTASDGAVDEWVLASGVLEDLGEGTRRLLSSDTEKGIAVHNIEVGDTLYLAPCYVSNWSEGVLLGVNEVTFYFVRLPDGPLGEICYTNELWDNPGKVFLNRQVELNEDGYQIDWLVVEAVESPQRGALVLKFFGEAEITVFADAEGLFRAYLEAGDSSGVIFAQTRKLVTETVVESVLWQDRLGDIRFRVPPEFLEKLPRLFPDGSSGVPDFRESPMDLPEYSVFKELFLKLPTVKSVPSGRARVILPSEVEEVQ